MQAPWPDVARSRAYRAVSRLPPALRRGHWLVGRGAVVVAAGPGKDLRLGARDLPLTHTQAYGLVRGSLEPSVQEALRRIVRPGAVVYDVGANLGFFSLLAARLAGDDGVVEAFEPVPASAAALRRNAQLNAFTSVRVHEVAVADGDRTGTLLVTGQPSCSHLADRGRHPDTRAEIRVPVVALDTLVARGDLRAPDVVKIDVEGSELAVVAGMREILRRSRPVLVCELHATNREFAALMADAGYAIENLDGPRPVEDAGHVNVLARPQGLVSGDMATTDDDPLERLSSKELHDLAVKHAIRHVDLGFFWKLLEILPAAEAAAGEVGEAAADVESAAARLDDLTDSGRGEVAEMLRPFYLEYLREHGVKPQ
jgi:FkbM family methyltransferase